MPDWYLICPECLDHARQRGARSPARQAIILYTSAEYDAQVKKYNAHDTGRMKRWADVLMNHYDEYHGARVPVTPEDAKALLFYKTELDGP